MHEELKIKQAEYNKGLSKLDSMLAERTEEMQELESLIIYKEKKYALEEAKIKAVQNKVSDAENKVKTILDTKERNVERIKENFKQWKLNQLDEVAKMKLKGKIANIDKAGLKDILGG